MAYIITEPCIGTKDASCVDVCPVDCIYTTEADPQYYIDPDTWLETTPVQNGSWWPSWFAWLAGCSGERTAPPPMGAPEQGYRPLGDAPGTYVLHD